jgi:tRNA(adenine34) deaminase
MNFQEIQWNMQLAMEEAEIAEGKGEVPIGCIITSPSGEIIARAHNTKEVDNDPSGHAEINALKIAGDRINTWRLNGCSVYVTLEPCPMCLNAMVHARIENLYFGAYDSKAGAISLGYNFPNDKRLNHHFKIAGGILHYKCSRILSNFFKRKRGQYNTLMR